MPRAGNGYLVHIVLLFPRVKCNLWGERSAGHFGASRSSPNIAGRRADEETDEQKPSSMMMRSENRIMNTMLYVFIFSSLKHHTSRGWEVRSSKTLGTQALPPSRARLAAHACSVVPETHALHPTQLRFPSSFFYT